MTMPALVLLPDDPNSPRIGLIAQPKVPSVGISGPRADFRPRYSPATDQQARPAQPNKLNRPLLTAFRPAMLNREEAAAYVGVSVSLFDEEVGNGLWPRPIMRGAKRSKPTWPVAALDSRIAQLAEHSEGTKREPATPNAASSSSPQMQAALARLKAAHHV